MSLSANIDHLAIAAGIEAVVVDTGSREYRGDDHWYRVLDGALDLFGRTDEKSIRLVVGKHTIVVQQEGEETVAVVLPTGHAIAKSLRRMIRRMARKDRGPLPKEFAEYFESGTPNLGQAANQPAAGTTGSSGSSTGSGPGVTTPSPSPMSAPVPTPPASGQPSVAPQPKTGDEAKPGTSQSSGSSGSSERSSTSSDRNDRSERSDRDDRGGFHNF